MRKKQNMLIEFLGRLFFIIPSTPKFAQIEITNKCNLNCKMCPRKFLNIPYKNMNIEVYKTIINNLDGVHTLTLTGWGEPFCYPEIFDCIQYAKKKGFKIKLTTNGTLLDNKKIEKIFEKGLDEITFSIDNIQGNATFGHSNLIALRNIQKIIELRKKKNLDKPKIVLQPTMHAGRAKDIYDIIKWGKKAEVDRINIARISTKFDPNLSRVSEEEEKEIFNTANKLSKKLGIRVDMVQYAVFEGFLRYIYILFRRIMHRFDSKCSKTYDFIYVNADGFVTPCCMFPNMKMGDLKKNTLNEIWNGKTFNEFRKNQEKICGNCDVMKIGFLGKR